MANISYNKRANFDYEISDKFEAGLILLGMEVKSIKTGHISLKESFVTIKGGELYLTNANIPPYTHAGKILNYNPTRSRKILLKRSEIKKLIGKVRTEGLTLVPISIYTKKRLLKLEFGIGKGKKKFDKRQTIAKREDTRSIQRAFRNS